MSEDQKVERYEERLEDMELKDDEAKEIAGGTYRIKGKMNPLRWGKASGETSASKFGKSES